MMPRNFTVFPVRAPYVQEQHVRLCQQTRLLTMKRHPAAWRTKNFHIARASKLVIELSHCPNAARIASHRDRESQNTARVEANACAGPAFGARLASQALLENKPEEAFHVRRLVALGADERPLRTPARQALAHAQRIQQASAKFFRVVLPLVREAGQARELH